MVFHNLHHGTVYHSVQRLGKHEVCVKNVYPMTPQRGLFLLWRRWRGRGGGESQVRGSTWPHPRLTRAARAQGGDAHPLDRDGKWQIEVTLRLSRAK
jgi:hypothetical protein